MESLRRDGLAILAQVGPLGMAGFLLDQITASVATHNVANTNDDIPESRDPRGCGLRLVASASGRSAP